MKSSDEILDSFQLTLKQLISINKEHREYLLDLLPGQFDRMSPSEYAREFSTVRCDIGRRSGKTEFIVLNATEDDLVIIPSVKLLPNYRDCKGQVVVGSGGLYGHDMERNYSTIFIDEPGLIPLINIQRIYDCLAKDKEQTFVLLGSERR